MSEIASTFPAFDSSPQAVTATERAAERLERLQNLARALTSADTVEQAADVVSREGFAALHAPIGAIYLRDASSNHFRFARAIGTPAALSDAPPIFASNFPDALLSAVRAKQPLFFDLDGTAALPADTAPPVPPGGTLAVLPLLIDDHILGGLELRWQRAPAFDAESRAYLQLVAQMCAHALERARLYEAEQAARRLAEQAMERTSRLQTVTARLARAATLAQVGEVVISEGTAALGAHRGVLALLEPEGNQLEVIQTWGYAPGNARAWQKFGLDAPIPLADTVRRQEAIWLHDLAERNACYPQLAQIQTTSHAYAVLPLLVEDRVLGGISFGFDHARDFDTAERAFVTALAQQCAQALERARLADVAAARLVEIEQLNARLKQALAETHHRVKNNLQVISALVELQTDVSIPTVPVEALYRIGGHARALASLHDLLTDQAKSSFDMSTISTRALLGKMLPILQSTIGGGILNSQIEDARLPVRIGASLCLLVNELVSNAVKHGGHVISLSLHSEPDRRNNNAEPARQNGAERRHNVVDNPVAAILRLVVEDDGPGFPPDFDPQKAAHTGLDLVSNLSRLDLGGSVAYANNPQGGACVTVTFPLAAA